jgi:hypothetical protein
MPWMPACHARIEVIDTARRVLLRRNSGRIIRLTSARNDVRGLLAEYRRFRIEVEAALAKDGIAITNTVRALLLEAWTDQLIAYRERAA